MAKLTDTQLIVLSNAAARDDGIAVMPTKMSKSVALKVGTSLVDAQTYARVAFEARDVRLAARREWPLDQSYDYTRRARCDRRGRRRGGEESVFF